MAAAKPRATKARERGGDGPLVALALDSSEPHPLLDAVLAAELPPGPALERSIDERDEMLAFLAAVYEGDRDQALVTYFGSGLRIFRALDRIVAWRFGTWARVGRLLDFASGYGRVTRHLARALPAERVTIAEILPEAVEFQQRTMGVGGLVSTARPEGFHYAERFDLVLVTSLFTHLPEATFGAWLERLVSVLAPGGLLVFSTHDQSLLDGEALPESGLLFHPVSESDALAKEEYGSTWVSEAFVRRRLAAIGEGELSCHRVPRGLCNHQDLYLVAREPGVDFSGLAFAGDPEGYVEGFELEAPDRLFVRGWAADPYWGAGVEEIEVEIDGRGAGTCRAFGPRRDVAEAYKVEPRWAVGWELRCPVPAERSRSAVTVLVRARGRAGFPRLLFAGSLESALLWSARRRLEAQEHKLRELAGDIAARKSLYADLERHVAGMEKSRAWKLRTAWFRLKSVLGLVQE